MRFISSRFSGVDDLFIWLSTKVTGVSEYKTTVYGYRVMSLLEPN